MRTKEERREIAETIAAQLGGHGFLLMSGAKWFETCELGVEVRLPAHGKKDAIRSMKIELNYQDEYDIHFYSMDGLNVITETVEGIYADNLLRVLEDHTGLCLRLPKIYNFKTACKRINRPASLIDVYHKA